VLGVCAKRIPYKIHNRRFETVEIFKKSSYARILINLKFVKYTLKKSYTNAGMEIGFKRSVCSTAADSFCNPFFVLFPGII
jgi:hypothetical protein